MNTRFTKSQIAFLSIIGVGVLGFALHGTATAQKGMDIATNLLNLDPKHSIVQGDVKVLQVDSDGIAHVDNVTASVLRKGDYIVIPTKLAENNRIEIVGGKLRTCLPVERGFFTRAWEWVTFSSNTRPYTGAGEDDSKK